MKLNLYFIVLQEFYARDDITHFKIPLKELLECLKIFYNEGKSANETTVLDMSSNAASLRLLYKSRGAPLEMM